MDQYVIRYKYGAAPLADLERIRSFPHVEVLDETSKMFLVRASPEIMHALMGQLPDWVSSENKQYRNPSPYPFGD